MRNLEQTTWATLDLEPQHPALLTTAGRAKLRERCWRTAKWSAKRPAGVVTPGWALLTRRKRRRETLGEDGGEAGNVAADDGVDGLDGGLGDGEEVPEKAHLLAA